MRITYKGDYALKAVLDLAVHYEQGVVTIHDIAGRIDAPIKFLEQVLADLKKGGFVESRRGKVGGYSLAKEPAQITLGEVARFIDGPIEPIACVDKQYSGCHDAGCCVFRGVWKEVASSTAKIIDNITFADLLKRSKKSNKALTYQI